MKALLLIPVIFTARKRVRPEIGTGTVCIVGSSLVAARRVAVEEMKKAE
jgi:hypothetical protein